MSEIDLLMVERHIRECERHVAVQRRIVAGLRRAGVDATVAEELLSSFEVLLIQHRANLARLDGTYMTPEFCLAKAEECEELAAEAIGAGQRYGWLQTARDWRIAAAEAEAGAATIQ
jgi:hypothetical protein